MCENKGEKKNPCLWSPNRLFCLPVPWEKTKQLSRGHEGHWQKKKKKLPAYPSFLGPVTGNKDLSSLLFLCCCFCCCLNCFTLIAD